ncbi:MAG: hypothetical protein JNJ50_08170 [Acidobacteria bacterium]|nr:hypothetical protein [Acidobacteriota bacterium]
MQDGTTHTTKNSAGILPWRRYVLLGCAVVIGLLLLARPGWLGLQAASAQDPSLAARTIQRKQEQKACCARTEKSAPEQSVIGLTSGVASSGTINPPSQAGTCILGATQYSINVPAGATQLTIALSGDQDVDLAVRYNQPVAISGGQLVRDYLAATFSFSETITITPSSTPALTGGTYFIAVLNCGTGFTTFSVTATVTNTPQTGNTVALTSGVPVTGTIQAPVAGSGILHSTQYTIQVPSGASQLVVTVAGSSQDIDLYIRFGQPVGLSNGALIADYVAQSFGVANETLTVNASSSPPLQAGTYYIALGNFGPGSANFTLTGTVGTGQTGGTSELSVDDGSFETAIGLVQGGTSVAVNRLNAGAYPATISAVKIFFSSSSNLQVGQPFTILVGTNTDGNADINGTSFQNVSANVQALGQFVTYSVPSVTIGSGDFVVGIRITANGFPFSQDLTNPYRQRSYLSTNGFAFTLADALGVPGNFGFRAIVSTPQQCSYSITPASQSFSASGGTGSVSVTTGSTCTWTASSNAAFVSISSGSSGTGNGTVGYTVQPNNDTQSRSGTLTIAGQSFTVTQAGQSCSYTISPASQSFNSAGGTGSVSVSSNAGCAWTATSNAAFITITSGQNGSGNGTVNYLVQPNNDSATRTGTITVAGQTFTVTQTGVSCNFVISPTSQSFNDTGGTGSVSVSASSGCAWSASSNSAFLTITSGQNGNGNGTVNFLVQSNPNSSSRTGTLTIAGQTFTVTQSGISCSFTISPASQNFAAGGGTGSVNVSTSAGCAWTASSNSGFLTITSGQNGNGNGTVNYLVQANNDQNQRIGTLTVAGQTFTVTQAGAVVSTNRNVRVANASGAPGGTVQVPIELEAQGDENALGFSLTFEASVLSSPSVALGSGVTGATLNVNSSQTGQGRIGIVLALPSGQVLQAGVRQIALVTFNVAANASNSTQVGFGDQPIPREVSNLAAQTLPANYQPGTVTFAQGYEADVAPRPSGSNNGSVTVTDWVQMGRFVANLDTVDLGSEFQRADCAPRDSKGNGVLSVTDLTQAGRYAAGLDPVVTAGGPTSPTVNAAAGVRLAAVGETARLMQLSPRAGEPGSYAVEFISQGGENAFGFSLRYDPARMRFVSAMLGTDTLPATLTVNAEQSGVIGVVLALPAGKALAAGARQLLTLQFEPLAGGNLNVSFGDQPVAREVSDVHAQAVLVRFVSGDARSLASVSAASFSGGALAADAIATIFGRELAGDTQAATSAKLPQELAGTTVSLRDSAGVERAAPLFFVSPEQLNYLVPSGTASGEATVQVLSRDGAFSAGQLRINAVAPGVFAANANGKGVAAAVVLRVRPDGSESYEPIARYDAELGRFVSVPIVLGDGRDQLYLLLFGTGIRHRTSLSAVSATLGGVPADVLYAGSQGGFAGLDQINLRLPRQLSGRGEIEVLLTVDGITANAVRVSIQ